MSENDPSKAMPIAPGNYDRAWNDPPMFSYNTAMESSNQKLGSKLKRRVGYPGSSSATSTSVNEAIDNHSNKLHPPPPKDEAKPPTLTSVQCNTLVERRSTLSIETITSMLQDFLGIYCEGKSTELLRRLDLMIQCLSENYNHRIHEILSDFTQHIKNLELTDGEKKLQTLAADHSAECVQWIICLRHLLEAVKEKNTVKASDNEMKLESPFFIPVAATNKN